MDPTLLSASSSNTATQGTHHHHHKSVSQQVDDMTTAIDDAVKAGTLTDDQAASMKKELADVTQTIGQSSQTSSTSSTGTSSQSNSLSQLSDADRKKVFGELNDVRKQLFSASNQQSSSATSAAGATSSSSAVNDLFSKIDTDGNGSIDKSELQTFLNSFSSPMYGQNGSSTPNALYSSTVNISA